MSEELQSTQAPFSFVPREPMAASPLWLEYSGLPEWVNAKVGSHAWQVLKKVMELDCAYNGNPGTIEIAPVEIARWCGLDNKIVMKTLEGLRKKKCLALFLPEHPEERALMEVRSPLPTPVHVSEIRKLFPFNTMGGDADFRYSRGEDRRGSKKIISSEEKPGLQRVVDLYFNNVSLKMNPFILDELRLICRRFDADNVEKAFEQARKNDIRSLGWVVKELYRLKNND